MYLSYPNRNNHHAITLALCLCHISMLDFPAEKFLREYWDLSQNNKGLAVLFGFCFP